VRRDDGANERSAGLRVQQDRYQLLDSFDWSFVVAAFVRATRLLRAGRPRSQHSLALFTGMAAGNYFGLRPLDFREAHRRLGGNEAEPKSVAIDDLCATRAVLQRVTSSPASRLHTQHERSWRSPPPSGRASISIRFQKSCQAKSVHLACYF